MTQLGKSMPWSIPKLYKLEEAAERVGIEPTKLRKLVRERGVGRRLGRTILLTELDVEAIINSLDGKNFEPNIVYVERKWKQPALKVNPSRSGGVYFIRSGDYVKIGVAMNVARRFATLQVAHPEDLELLLEVPGGPVQEAALQKQFCRYRVRGEWFRLSDEIETWIEEQRGNGP